MIFQHTWRQVLDGTKTQTRRLKKPGETVTRDIVFAANKHIKWRVGQTYAVQPGRGLPCIMQDCEGGYWIPERERRVKFAPVLYRCEDDSDRLAYSKYGLEQQWGAREARICITAILEEHIQNISEEDAHAELGDLGYWVDQFQGETFYTYWEQFQYEPSRGMFRWLWDTIHVAPGTTWADNPEDWALTFALVEEGDK